MQDVQERHDRPEFPERRSATGTDADATVVTPRSSETVEGASTEGQPWYRMSTNILLAVLFLPPLGLFLLWKYAPWSLAAKVFGTLWALLLIALGVVFVISLVPSAFSLYS